VAPGDAAVHPNAAVRVHVVGHVNNPGWVELTPPLTIDHAVELAGGISALDLEHTPAVRVFRTDDQQFLVRRSAWTAFALHDNDLINIPKKIFP
jgi:protein involved in polysaccharide export with SLBB domain